MYCPSCGTQNADGASYCRGCGANVSLVPQALTGRLTDPRATESDEGDSRRGRHRHRGPSIERAVTKLFSGLAFIFVALALAFTRMGRGWWFWLLIPAFSMLGTAVADYLGVKNREKSLSAGSRPAQTADFPPARNTAALPPRETPAGYAPGSVTEGTTRLLERDEQQ